VESWPPLLIGRIDCQGGRKPALGVKEGRQGRPGPWGQTLGPPGGGGGRPGKAWPQGPERWRGPGAGWRGLVGLRGMVNSTNVTTHPPIHLVKAPPPAIRWPPDLSSCPEAGGRGPGVGCRGRGGCGCRRWWTSRRSPSISSPGGWTTTTPRWRLTKGPRVERRRGCRTSTQDGGRARGKEVGRGPHMVLPANSTTRFRHHFMSSNTLRLPAAPCPLIVSGSPASSPGCFPTPPPRTGPRPLGPELAEWLRNPYPQGAPKGPCPPSLHTMPRLLPSVVAELASQEVGLPLCTCPYFPAGI